MPEPIRVLHVVNDLAPGGVASVVLELAAGMDATAFETTVLSLSDEMGALELTPLPGHVRVLAAPAPVRTDYSLAAHLAAALRPGREARRYRAPLEAARSVAPAILHFHTGPLDLAFASLARTTTGARVIFTDHSIRLRKGDYPAHVGAALAFAFRRLYRRCHLVAVGEHVAARHRELRLVGRGRRHVVLPNRVDPRRFRPAEAPLPESPFEWVYVARLHPLKGHDVLLRAFSACAAAREMRLTLVGPEATEGAEAAAARGLPRPGREVRCLGIRQDVPDILRGSHAGVFPSLREGRPLALQEMLATGLPVVACDLPEIAESVVDGVNGLLVPPGDAGALGRAMDRVAEDGALRARLGAEARRSVEGEPGQAPAEAMAELYRDVLGHG